MDHITEEEARPKRGRKAKLVIDPGYLEDLKKEIHRTPKRPVVTLLMSDFLYNAKLPKKYDSVWDSAYLAYRLSKRYRSEGLAFSSRTYAGPGIVKPHILVYDSSREDKIKGGRRSKRKRTA